jgi:YidC/Oxa1 family membrane protein insertase
MTLDENYLFTVTQQVENRSGTALTLHPYGLIARVGLPETTGFYILHEGPLGVFGGTLAEHDYEDLMDKGEEVTSTGGWIGITDKYWLTALAPDANAPFTGNFRYINQGNGRFQVDYLREAMTIADGASAEVTDRLFAGAKEVKLLENYRDNLNIEKLDLAIDFGWLHWLTKPLFKVLAFFNAGIGNMGLSILALTVCVKAIFFPLANKSYKSMSRMKALQPEIEKLRERYGDDRAKLNQEMMGLYKTQKVNPAAGCLPIVVQIPVFFALYKVLYVSIEMRHAPFFGWITDLSAPDPTTLFNLFGLLPYTPPDFLMIGVWPLAMGISMFLQQKLNPQPADPIQAKIFLFMPLFFTFLLAPFAAGLVVYWTWNNLLSMTQQFVIMKRMGVPIGGTQSFKLPDFGRKPKVNPKDKGK